MAYSHVRYYEVDRNDSSGWTITFKLPEKDILLLEFTNEYLEMHCNTPGGVVYSSIQIPRGYETFEHLTQAMWVRVKDEDDPSGYRYVEPELHIGEGGKLKGNKHDNLLVGTTEDDAIVGKLGDDILHGEDISKTVWLAGNDQLFGGGGNDLFYGGSGNNALYGGQGADIFILEKFDGSNLGDQVMDFEIGTDQIRPQANWVEDGWISLNFTPDANDKTVDVEIILEQWVEDGELSDCIEKYDALPPDFDSSVNKITLRDVNYEGGDIFELFDSPVGEDNILFDVA